MAKIKLGFTTLTSIDRHPRVCISVDDQLLVADRTLDACGSTRDPAAVMQFVCLDCDLDLDGSAQHVIRVQGLNLLDERVIGGDFGVQLRYVEIQGVNLDYFFRDMRSFNTVGDQDRMTDIHGLMGRVEQGEHANYINSPNAWIECHWSTPFYQWLLQGNFGYITRSALIDIDTAANKYHVDLDRLTA